MEGKQQPLITRDRLLEFSQLRKAAQEQQQWLSGSHNREITHTQREPLQSSTAVTYNSPDRPPPPWVRALKNFTELENTIRLRMDRLHNQQRELLQPRFSSMGEEEDQMQEVEKLGAGVQKLLKELEYLVLNGMKAQDSSCADEIKAAQNAQRHLSTRLSRLIAAFRDGQELFAVQLKRRDEKIKRFSRIGTKESHERLEREEKIVQYLELGYTQADIQELLIEEAKQQEVSREVMEVLESVRELHEMFSDLGSLVVDQGTVLDRIEYNIQETQANVEKGVGELRKARERQNTCITM